MAGNRRKLPSANGGKNLVYFALNKAGGNFSSAAERLLRRCSNQVSVPLGGGADQLIRKYDHFTPARKMRQDGRALTARNLSKDGFIR